MFDRLAGTDAGAVSKSFPVDDALGHMINPIQRGEKRIDPLQHVFAVSVRVVGFSDINGVGIIDIAPYPHYPFVQLFAKLVQALWRYMDQPVCCNVASVFQDPQESRLERINAGPLQLLAGQPSKPLTHGCKFFGCCVFVKAGQGKIDSNRIVQLKPKFLSQ